MSLATPGLTNFTRGELSPRLYGRVDVQHYFNGARSIKNFIVHPHGGATFRSGFRYVAKAGSQNSPSLLVPFEFNVEQTYVLEFFEDGDGLGQCHVFRNRGQVLDGPVPYQFAIPWKSSDFQELAWTQTNDTLFVVHGDYRPRRVTRTGHTAWVVTETAFKDGPYLDENDTATTLTLSATSGTATVTASSVVGINNGSGFLPTDVGRVLTIEHASRWGWGTITARASTTQVTISIGRAFGDITASASWRLGLFSDTTGWPSVVEFFEDRICFAGAKDHPNVIAMSRSGDYESFSWNRNVDSNERIEGEPLADDAITARLASSQQNAVEWLVPRARLYVGTAGAEWTIGGPSVNEPITPTSVKSTPESSYGSHSTQPLTVDNAAVYIQRSCQKLREMAYSFEKDSHASVDLTVLSEHITKGGVNALVFSQEPDSIIHVLRSDGQVPSLTYQRDQEVVAWWNMETAGKVESVAVIHDSEQARDQLWVQVCRNVGGETRRFIEFLESTFEADDTAEAFFLDAGLTYDGRNKDDSMVFTLSASNAWVKGSNGTLTASGFSPFSSNSVGDVYRLQAPALDAFSVRKPGASVEITTLLTPTTCQVAFLNTPPESVRDAGTANWALMTDSPAGATHLAGGVVSVLADGATHPDVLVASNGSFQLSRLAAVVVVGLPYSGELQPMKLEGFSERGTAQTKKKRVSKVSARFYKTLGGKIGPSAEKMETVYYRSPSDPMDAAPVLFDGDKEVLFPDGWNRDGLVMIRQDQPLPMSVLMIVPTVVTNE